MGSVGISYEDWWAAPALPVLSRPAHDHLQGVQSNQGRQKEGHGNNLLLSSSYLSLNLAHQKTKCNYNGKILKIKK